MTSKNRLEVKIAGKSYTLVGEESEEYIQRIALYIDKKMNDIMRINHTLSTSASAVLSAINIADDFFKASEAEKKLSAELKQVKEELERTKAEVRSLSEESTSLAAQNASMRIELARREAELREVRNTLDMATRART